VSRLNHFLHGIRVVDVSFYIPGPMASLQLADMGAEVTKVEPPGGDDMRALGPRDGDGRPLFYAALNAGKTVMRLNLKQDEGRAALLALTDRADIFIEGFRPGVMARLGLDPETLRARNPRLITCSISGYGAAGPLAQQAGHDGNYLAGAGVLHRNGVPPRFFDPPIADLSGSLFAVIAILGALQARAADGRGCHIDLGLADVAMPLQLFEIAGFGATGQVPQPNATYLNGGAAYYQIYPVAEGRHVMLGAVEAKFWHAFCQAAGHPDWIARQAEPLPQHALTGDVAGFFTTLTLDDCGSRFTGECCVSPVLDLAEAVASPHHAGRGLVTRSGGGLQSLFPAWIDGAPPQPRKPLMERQ
jgi:alpha-methylacyl-CoA racemase